MTPAAGPHSKARSHQGATRERILEAAYALVLRHGFTATTIDRVLAGTGLTKGAFFHYFGSKAALAKALAQRYADDGLRSMRERFVRAEQRTDDPLQHLLLYIDESIEEAEKLAAERPVPAGCLFACIAYELEEHTDEVREIMRASVAQQCAEFEARVHAVLASHPARMAVDPAELAEHLYAVYDGGLVAGRVLGDAHAVARQLRQVRNHVCLLFAPKA